MQIQTSGKRMLSIVNDILDVGSTKHGDFTVKQVPPTHTSSEEACQMHARAGREEEGEGGKEGKDGRTDGGRTESGMYGWVLTHAHGVQEDVSMHEIADEVPCKPS